VVTSPPIIVALDLPTAEDAVRLAQSLVDHVGGFKIGLGLLHGPGPATITALAELGRPVFADAKLHDIPSQVEAAAERLGDWGARWVTVHLSGGPAMVEAAVTGLRRGSGGAAGILGVSVLTSLDRTALSVVGIQATPGKLVSRMARMADATGCEGVVCSPRELGIVADVAPELVRVTPGIRPAGAATPDDQARTATPEAAIEHGASWLVVGRPITRAPDPVAAAAAIAGMIAEARDTAPTTRGDDGVVRPGG
jgi:orotidine-5'-phosphate decarboxylase